MRPVVCFRATGANFAWQCNMSCVEALPQIASHRRAGIATVADGLSLTTRVCMLLSKSQVNFRVLSSPIPLARAGCLAAACYRGCDLCKPRRH